VGAFAAIVDFSGAPLSPGRRELLARACAAPAYDLAAHVTLAGAVRASEEALTLVGDVRLDNRAELATKLGAAARGCDEAALVLRAYQRWGEEAPLHLEGDFAFAIWDAEAARLFCARDHFGVAPFCYWTGQGAFACGSHYRAIEAAHALEPDDSAVADYLLGIVSDKSVAFFRNVRRLAPAWALTVSRRGRREAPFWRFARMPEVEPADAPAAFRARFEAAVGRRLAGARKPAALLSGGLDSSSIACVAARQRDGEPFPVFSMVFDATPQWSERVHIETVLAAGSFAPTILRLDARAPFADARAMLAEAGAPFLAPVHYLTRLAERAAAEAGVDVLLSGHGGDEVVSHGLGRLTELACARDWPGLWREARGEAGLYGEARSAVFAAYFGHYAGRGRLARLALRYARLRAHAHRPEPAAGLDLLAPDFAVASGAAARFAAATALADRAEAERHFSILDTPSQSSALEYLHHAGTGAGIAPRFPFWDRALVEFCLALPAHWKLRDGWPRYILRRAMAGVVPQEILWRRDKLDFSAHFKIGLAASFAVIDPILADDGAELARYVNLGVLRGAYARLRANPVVADSSAAQSLWRVVMFALWRDMRAPARNE